jgi:DNA-binding CsgD family transcriptional regulator/PAS domain-containing protein
MTAAARAPSDRYERAAALLERLYESPSSRGAWRRFLAALCEDLSGDVTAILLGAIAPGRPTAMLAHGIDLTGVPPERLLPIGPQPSEKELPTGSVLVFPRESELLARTQLYRSVLAKQGLPAGPGFAVVLDRTPQQVTGALLVLARDPAWQPTADDQAVLELLAPSVRRAVIAGLGVNERRGDVQQLLELLDSLALGVVLLDEKSHVTFVNRSAMEIVGAAAPRPGEPTSESSQQRGEAALRGILRGLALGGPRASLALPHPEDGRPVQLMAAPLEWPEAGSDVAARFTTALFLTDPMRSSREAPIEGLAALYGLTPGEERLASLLAAGCTLAEAAARLAIRPSTARGVLKAVFAKTGARRQASLVNLILAGPGQLRQ